MRLTGEDVCERSLPCAPAASQPGGRPAAPGQLGVLQAFLNTRYDLAGGTGAEVLSSASALGRWLAQSGLVPIDTRVTHEDLQRVLVIRDGLHELLGDPPTSGHSPSALNRALSGASLQLQLSPAGLELAPRGSRAIDRALARLAAVVVRSIIEDSWSRLKVCPGPHCGWVFYDHSRNNSSRWCSMRVCGGRVKAQAHYRRRRAL